ncbi:MAG: hypothetical protein ACPGWR_09270, partial [Ardenticatenaceae bacterium]
MIDKPASENTSMASYQQAGSYLKGLSLLFLSLVILLALWGVGYGSFNQIIADNLRWLVGWGAYFVAILIGVRGWLFLWGYSWHDKVSWGRTVAAEVIFFCLLAISTLRTNPDLSLDAALWHRSGGIIGWVIAKFVSPLGTSGAQILLSVLLFLLLPSLFNGSLQRLQEIL